MLKFIGKEIGNAYVKEKKLSLLSCNEYDVMEDNISIGNFFSGFRHSGEKYFSFTFNKHTLISKIKSDSFFKSSYNIVQANDDKVIGYFEYSNWSWLNGKEGTLLLIDGQVYQFRAIFGILTKIWQDQRPFEIYSDTDIIKYSIMKEFGTYNIDTKFTGIITIDNKRQIIPAILGLFFVDIKLRKWVENNNID